MLRIGIVLAIAATWIARTALVAILLVDALTVLRCLGLLVIGGVPAVHGWIIHVASIGEPFLSGNALDTRIRGVYVALGVWIIIVPAGLYAAQRWTSRWAVAHRTIA